VPCPRLGVGMLTAIYMPMQSQRHGTQPQKSLLALRALVHDVLSKAMGRALRIVIVGASLLATVANCARADVASAPPDGNPRVAAIFPFLFGGASQPLYDSLPGDVKPHPAVARIIVPEDGSTAYGSGTLVGVRDQHGLVVTNWHVVRDAVGMVEVVFPDGFRSNARPIQVDQDWDLAALVVWRPPGIEPVRIAAQPPRPGDVLTIHGYGRGKYRIATGRCTTYYAPQPNYPHEMVELDVEARQGDSGGPIFNQSGELAGVLFGAGQGTTMGAFSPRVRYFLAAVAPNLEQSNAQAQVAVADRPPPVVNMPIAKPAEELTVDYPSSPWLPPKPAAVEASHGPAAAPQLVSTSAPASTANEHPQATPPNWYEPAKTVLAAIGLAAIGLRLGKVIL
jgi:S1-C subfamily serine protease